MGIKLNDTYLLSAGTLSVAGQLQRPGRVRMAGWFMGCSLVHVGVDVRIWSLHNVLSACRKHALERSLWRGQGAGWGLSLLGLPVWRGALFLWTACLAVLAAVGAFCVTGEGAVSEVRDALERVERAGVRSSLAAMGVEREGEGGGISSARVFEADEREVCSFSGGRLFPEESGAWTSMRGADCARGSRDSAPLAREVVVGSGVDAPKRGGDVTALDRAVKRGVSSVEGEARGAAGQPPCARGTSGRGQGAELKECCRGESGSSGATPYGESAWLPRGASKAEDPGQRKTPWGRRPSQRGPRRWRWVERQTPCPLPVQRGGELGLSLRGYGRSIKKS